MPPTVRSGDCAVSGLALKSAVQAGRLLADWFFSRPQGHTYGTGEGLAKKTTQQVIPDRITDYHQIIIKSHVARFHASYQSYFNRKESRELVEYFFEKIYSLEGKQRRDEVAVKTYKRFKALLSEKARDRIEKLLYLNEMTDTLDLKMAAMLAQRPDWAGQAVKDGILETETYRALYRLANTYEERLEQLGLVIWNLESFFELSKHPLAEMVMRPAYVAAAMVGAKDVFYVFEQGYNATKPVSKELFAEFLAAVKKNEAEFLEQLYGVKTILT